MAVYNWKFTSELLNPSVETMNSVVEHIIDLLQGKSKQDLIHCLFAFTLWDIWQYVYCNCL